VKIVRLSGCKNFVRTERSLYSMRSLTVNQWKDENGSDMSGFKSLNVSTSKRVLNMLEPVKLESYDRENYSS